jgi:hypothetical protein
MRQCRVFGNAAVLLPCVRPRRCPDAGLVGHRRLHDADDDRDGSSSLKCTGATQIADSPGDFSDLAILGDFVTKRSATIAGFAIVTNLFNRGFAFYDIELFCVKADGTIHDPTTFKKVQDQ